MNPPMTPAELDRWFATIDAVAEADRLAGITTEAVMNAGQAAVDALNARRALSRTSAALLAFAVMLGALAACGPAAGSPNCPPGQWYADKPGTGWICASDPPFVYTPGYTFGPSSPAESAP